MSNIPKVLIVDDDSRMCESLAALLSDQGYVLKTCNSGKEAIEYLNKNTFDLVLLDIVISDMDGYQIMDYINKQSPDTLVIVITGNASTESAITALRKGAYDYIRKPFEPEELLITVKNSLDHKRLKSENEVVNEKLTQSEERYRYLVQNSPDIIYMLDDQGKFTFISNAVEWLLGFKTEQLIGKQYTTIFHKDDLAKAKRSFNERRAGDRAASPIELRLKVCSDSCQFKSCKAEYLTVELKSRGIYDKPITEKGKKFLGTYGVIRDISDKKRLESQLQQTYKLEAIGVLSGGIAHDFNNLLSIITGNIELAKDDVKPEMGISEFLHEAEEASLKAQKLTNQLITFSKGGTPVKKIGSIQDMIKETTNYILSDSNIRCDFLVSQDLWPVEFDQDQMKHAINNMIVNAAESMPDEGTIDVRAENISIITKQSLPLSEGNYVKISIRDHGVGIPEKHLPKIFDPYFSTKEMGTQKGMGLGLATTYSIINRHGGHIT
ncbi:MAG: response regulator, partial [Deltaproteobacteria bacterium]|nr:response regulator [Deltaproteobacteria bacterium]